MSKKNETSVQVIENASPEDIQAGDQLIWERAWKRGGVTMEERREGIADHRDAFGDWRAVCGRTIIWGMDAGTTLTIRRPITKES